jgi:NADH dehydrogenase/NADH:ubiquinone oxidoreductase subunit G
MRYSSVTDRYEPIGWDGAFDMIGARLRALENPDRADFYISGRTSNEAAFLYQLFVRRFGTNNFPDCSNMCHEATSVGLPESIGIGKGAVLLEDFDKTDAIFVIGQNPSTNSPRMMTSLREASRRGIPIVAMNPLRERSLERFAAPQDRIEMSTLGSTRIAGEYCQFRVGGDVGERSGAAELPQQEKQNAVRKVDSGGCQGDGQTRRRLIMRAEVRRLLGGASRSTIQTARHIARPDPSVAKAGKIPTLGVH